MRHVDVELVELPVFHRCDAEHHPCASLAGELPVHFAFSRALPIWPFRGRLCFTERGRLRWKMVDVHCAHRGLEQGSVASASRATLRGGLRGDGKQVVQFSYGGRYLLMGAALATLVYFRLTLVVGRVFSRFIRSRLCHKRFFWFKLLRSCPLRPKSSPRLMFHSLQRKRTFRLTRSPRLTLFRSTLLRDGLQAPQ